MSNNLNSAKASLQAAQSTLGQGPGNESTQHLIRAVEYLVRVVEDLEKKAR